MGARQQQLPTPFALAFAFAFPLTMHIHCGWLQSTISGSTIIHTTQIKCSQCQTPMHNLQIRFDMNYPCSWHSWLYGGGEGRTEWRGAIDLSAIPSICWVVSFVLSALPQEPVYEWTVQNLHLYTKPMRIDIVEETRGFNFCRAAFKGPSPSRWFQWFEHPQHKF